MARKSDSWAKNRKNMEGVEVDTDNDSRLSKRLCYLLRYGAVKEGLHVHEGGYVDIDMVMELNIMRHNTEAEVREEVNKSLSHRGAKRFEMKETNGKTFIRACFCRKFEMNPFHDGTAVTTLIESCLDFVSSNLEKYDLENFPDEHLISNMIHRLKKQKKLNNATLRQLLVPALEHLDLDGVYLTEGTIKTMWRSCPYLRVLSLKDCGYLMTDSLMEQLLKNLPYLESISLCSCKHLTDRTLKAFIKRSKHLKELNLSWIRTMSENALIELIEKCPSLEYLDIYDHKISMEARERMSDLARGRKLTIVLKGLTDTHVAPENPCSMLPNFGKVW